jgi:hypothetical protein
MGKLIHILAASVAGGLVLGASIRLGEALGSSAVRARRRGPEDDFDGLPGAAARPVTSGGATPENRASHVTHQANHATGLLFADRLDRLEEKLEQANSRPAGLAGEPDSEWRDALAGAVMRVERQQTDMETMRFQVAKATCAMESVARMTDSLRHEIHEKLSKDLDERLAAIEETFRYSIESANRGAVDAVLVSMETQIAPRIEQLEADIAGQSAAMAELRDCSLQSERGIQRLLGVLERVMNPARAGERNWFGPGEAGLAAVGSKGQEDPASSGGETRRKPGLGSY